MAIESRDELLEEFQEFYKNYKTDEGEFIYIDKISRMIRDGQRSLVVDYEDLVLMDDTYEYDLVDTLLQNPDFAIHAASDALSSQVRVENSDYHKLVIKEKDPFTIRFTNIPSHMPIRDLRANHVDSLRWFEGIVIRTTEIKSIITEAVYYCVPNNHQIRLLFEHGVYKKPDFCTEATCKAKDYILDLKESKMIDWQFMTLQEKPEDLPPGASPKSIPCRLIDDVVNAVRPGDRIHAAGIVRTKPTKQIKKGQLLTYDLWVDVNFVESLTKEDEYTLITPEEEKQFLELASDPKIHDHLINSVAPAIFGMERVKEAALAVLFAGVDKVFPDGFTTRGQPNVLLVGDPGIAKSQMLKSVQGISPRGLYTSGKGSSAAGLCVAGESQIIVDNAIHSISDLVESQFEEGEIVRHSEGIDYIENSSSKFKTYHSENLKLNEQQIERFWKIRSPRKLIEISSHTGRKLTLTPETTLFSIDSHYGLVWKQAQDLSKGERIASIRRLVLKTINPPTMLDVIRDYPSRIMILDQAKNVKRLVQKIQELKDITIQQIADLVNVSPDTLHRWKSTRRNGPLAFQKLLELCRLAEEDIASTITDDLFVQTSPTKTIKLPLKFDPNWFYIFGLLIADGRLSLSRNKGLCGGVSIGLSNDEPKLTQIFSNFSRKLGFTPTTTPASPQRSAETRIYSKLLAHIFEKFELTYSPKADHVTPNPDILAYPDAYLTQFTKGLFDSDGWISIGKDVNSGSSHIGFSSTSKKLVEFVQNTLLKYEIISYVRKRDPKVIVKSDGTKIISRFPQYDLTFTKFDSFTKFAKTIGFNHPLKMSLLKKYCQQGRKEHSNIDNIPNINRIVRELSGFYNYTIEELIGRKSSLSPYSDKYSYTKNRLTKILSKMELDWRLHRREIPYHIRSGIYRELRSKLSVNAICKMLQLEKHQIHDWFIRTGRSPKIPMKIFDLMLNKKSISLSPEIITFLRNLIDEVILLDKEYMKQFKFLKQINNSDLYWDEIAEVDVVEAKEEYVYDLTIPKTHNFIVNGFVVHNTAAIIRDPDTGEITLEAGALVLADRGLCLTGDTEILTSDGSLIDIQTLVDCNFRPEVISFDANSFELKTDEIVNVSSRFSKDVYHLTFSTGDELKGTQEHPIPTWDNGVIWKTIENINEEDVVIDFRTYPFTSSHNAISPDFAEYLGLICSDGSLSSKKYNINFYTKSEELKKRYFALVKELFGVKVGKYIDKRNQVNNLYFANKGIHTRLRRLGVPNKNKSKSEINIPALLSSSTDIIVAFFAGLINGDGSISNRKGGGIIDIIVGNSQTATFYRTLLRRIGCISRISKIKTVGGGVVGKGDCTIWKLSITGIRNIAKLNHSSLVSYKKMNLEKILARKDLSEKIYKIDALIKTISEKLLHGKKHLLYKNSIRKSTLRSYGTTRSVIEKLLLNLKDEQLISTLDEYKILDSIISNDVHFMKVTSKEKIEPQKVYNIQVAKNQTYFANFIPVHNCLIDEFDKMTENDRSAIHEAMEQNTISIAKAGIVATLNARTGIFAAANPKYGRYEPQRTFSENVNLSPAILSRFDLVFVLQDEPEEESDAILADHILKLHRFHGSIETNKPPLTEDELRKYIAYAKTHYNPALTEEAADVLEQYYVEMRNSVGRSKEAGSRSRVTITARQLEGIVRLAESRARAGLRNQVSKHDALMAIELMKFSLDQIATDPETGEPDIDSLYSGQTHSRRTNLSKLMSIIDFLHRESGGKPFDESELIIEADREDIDAKYVEGAIEQLKRDGALYTPKPGKLKKPDN